MVTLAWPIASVIALAFTPAAIINEAKVCLSAPKLPDEPDDVPEAPEPEPPPFSADEREPGEAVDPPGATATAET
jgi:hypothetical protein